MQVETKNAGQKNAVAHFELPKFHIADELLDNQAAGYPALDRALPLRHSGSSTQITTLRTLPGFATECGADDRLLSSAFSQARQATKDDGLPCYSSRSTSAGSTRSAPQTATNVAAIAIANTRAAAPPIVIGSAGGTS